MKILLRAVILFFVSNGAFAQTWSDNVATIVYNKCSSCHHQGGIAPFSLMNYNEVSAMASAMYDAIALDEMPPYPPDLTYQQYTHPRALSPSEKTTMLNWLTNGTPEGNAQNTPPPPVFNTGSILGNGDLTIQIPTYMSKAQNGQDDYVCFSLPTNLAQNRFIRAIEIIPGNRETVHHALVYVDPTGAYIGDTVGGDCAGPQNATLIGGYTPGSSPLVFPSGSSLKLGMSLPANSNIVLAMHYPVGSYGTYDSTKVIFHFYPTTETGIREVYAAPVLQNWSLSIPPNQQVSFTARYPSGSGTIPTAYSLLSVFPHMHLLGKTIKAYGIGPTNDTIKLARINHWDFHWQDFYFFKYMQKIPAGSYLKGEATYDNTSANPHNPSNPPVWVTAGEGTTDEMFLVYFHFLAYQNGDENIDLESLMNLGLYESISSENVKVYPLPFSSEVTIEPTNLNSGDLVSMRIYDMQGRLIRTLAESKQVQHAGEKYSWDGKNDSGSLVEQGTYYLSLNVNGIFTSLPLIRR